MAVAGLEHRQASAGDSVGDLLGLPAQVEPVGVDGDGNDVGLDQGQPAATPPLSRPMSCEFMASVSTR